MLKYLLNFLFIFLMLSTYSAAKHDNIEAKLQGEYGSDLTHAPFYLRYSFHKEYKKDWKVSSYTERKAFLTDYDKGLAAEQRQEKADARAEAKNERDRLRDQRTAEREARADLRAEQAEERAEQKEYADRQKSFNTMVQGQGQALQQMKQESTQGN